MKTDYLKLAEGLLENTTALMEVIRKYESVCGPKEVDCPGQIYAPLYDIVSETLSVVESSLEGETSSKAKSLVQRLEKIDDDFYKMTRGKLSEDRE